MAILHRDFDINISDGHKVSGNNIGQHQLRQVTRLVQQESEFIDNIRGRLCDLERKLDSMD